MKLIIWLLAIVWVNKRDIFSVFLLFNKYFFLVSCPRNTLGKYEHIVVQTRINWAWKRLKDDTTITISSVCLLMHIYVHGHVSLYLRNTHFVFAIYFIYVFYCYLLMKLNRGKYRNHWGRYINTCESVAIKVYIF